MRPVGSLNGSYPRSCRTPRRLYLPQPAIQREITNLPLWRLGRAPFRLCFPQYSKKTSNETNVSRKIYLSLVPRLLERSLAGKIFLRYLKNPLKDTSIRTERVRRYTTDYSEIIPPWTLLKDTCDENVNKLCCPHSLRRRKAQMQLV